MALSSSNGFDPLKLGSSIGAIVFIIGANLISIMVSGKPAGFLLNAVAIFLGGATGFAVAGWIAGLIIDRIDRIVKQKLSEVEKLDDQEKLADIAKNDKDRYVRKEAKKRLKEFQNKEPH